MFGKKTRKRVTKNKPLNTGDIIDKTGFRVMCMYMDGHATMCLISEAHNKNQHILRLDPYESRVCIFKLRDELGHLLTTECSMDTFGIGLVDGKFTQRVSGYDTQFTPCVVGESIRNSVGKEWKICYISVDGAMVLERGGKTMMLRRGDVSAEKSFGLDWSE